MSAEPTAEEIRAAMLKTANGKMLARKGGPGLLNMAVGAVQSLPGSHGKLDPETLAMFAAAYRELEPQS